MLLPQPAIAEHNLQPIESSTLDFIAGASTGTAWSRARPILDVSLRGSRSRQGWDNGIPNQRLLVLQVGVMMMMVMAVVYHHHDLRLCRVGYRETEDEHETEQSLFHALSMPLGKSIYRATMTTPNSLCIREVGTTSHAPYRRDSEGPPAEIPGKMKPTAM
jgi:hypothetical protein